MDTMIPSDPIILPDPGVLAIAGDWHGNIIRTKSILRRAMDNGVNTIVQAGDFGYWGQETPYLTQLSELLVDNDITVYFVDGNHENHHRLNALSLDGGVRPVLPNITHLPRGLRWHWGEDDHTWMALGGAVSVDQNRRIPGHSWFPEEELTMDEVDFASRAGGVDVIIAHDAPMNVPELDYLVRGRHSNWPVEYLNLSDQHARKVTDVMLATDAKFLYHGHFHVRYDDAIGDTAVIGLAHEGYVLDNIVITDLSGAITYDYSAQENRVAAAEIAAHWSPTNQHNR